MLHGYISKASDNKMLEKELIVIKNKLNDVASIEFGKMLGEELARLNDFTTLKILLNKNLNFTLFEQARYNVKLRTEAACKIGANTRYNLSIGIKIINHENRLYYHVLAGNDFLYDAFSALDNISYDDTHHMPGITDNKTSRLWESLLKSGKTTYSETYICDYCVDMDKVTIPSLEERLQSQAFYAVFNYYLAQLSMGANIPPVLLAPYTEEVLTLISTREGEALMGRKVAELKKLLFPIDINAKHFHELN